MQRRPSGYPLMHQDWRKLLFLHWKYPADEVQKTLPPGLYVDTFDNDAYISITPFIIENFRIPPLPSVPGFSTFIEVNLRTYVKDENGNPGIWFYSLDLNSFMAVQAARAAYVLPYYFADLTHRISKDMYIIEGKREQDPHVKMHFAYRPVEEDIFVAQEGSLDFFLIERYNLFSFSANQLSVARVHHKPYPLVGVEVLKQEHTFEFKLNEDTTLSHFSPGVDVDIFPLKPIYRSKNASSY